MRIMTISAAVALLSALGATTGAAVAPMACDLDNNSYIDASEAKKCTEQRFEQVTNGQKGFGEEQFGQAFPQVQNRGALFKQLDQDKDGQISRQEWADWHGQAFATATAKSGSQMPAADYQKWSDEAYTRPTPLAEQSSQ